MFLPLVQRNVASPVALELIGCWEDAAVREMAATGHHLYVATDDPLGRLRVLDIANPATPTEVGFISDGGGAPIAVGDNLLLTTRLNTLYVFNVTDPDTPRRRITLNVGDAGEAMALAGDYLFVRCGRVRVCVLSIANRWYPQLRASTIVPAADISKLLVFDDRLYVGSSDGLLVYRHCFVDNGPCGVPATYFPLITR